MAGLYKQPGSSRWTAVFTDATGKQIRRSTRQRDRKAALSIAVAWENAAKDARNGKLFEAQARRIVSEMVEKVTGEPIHFHSCREWFTEWLAGKDGAVAAATLTKYRQVTTDFLDHIARRANLPLSAISPADVRGFRDSLKAKGLSASTVNQTVRKSLTTPFEAARRLGYITVNPCHAVEALKDDAETQRDAFTAEQIGQLLKAAKAISEDWQGLVLAGYYTGLRLKDITGLLWENIDLSKSAPVIRIKPRKTGKVQVTPILPALLQWIKAQPPGIGKAPLFPTLHGKKANGRAGLSNTFTRDIMGKAKIKGRILRAATEEGKGRTTTSLSFHSLRHSFNTHLANAGVPQEIRQRLTGHASAAMNDRYTHHELKTLRAAMEKLPSIPA